MGVDFGVILAADLKNALRFHVRWPNRRLRVTHRSPSHQNSKKLTDISLWVSILGLFWPLISIMPIDRRSAGQESPAASQGSPAARRHTKILKNDIYINIGIDFGVIWAADFNNVKRFYVCRPTRRPADTRRHTKMFRKQQIYRYKYRFYDYLGCWFR